MSEATPARLAPPPPPPPRRGSFVFTFSILLNFFLLVFVGLAVAVAVYGDDDPPPRERFHSGKSSAKDKVAIVRLDGVIMEGLLGFVERQIDAAAKDDDVKAVVLRVDSPGGSITGSDDLHRRLTEMRDGHPGKKRNPKKLVVSMGGTAASGGYYVAMPAETIFAERTTITGSIGVYAALPNVAKLSKDYGVGMNVIKRGEVKDSGSPFREMRPEEWKVWDDMVGHAYEQFLAVVEKGRAGRLRKNLREPIIDREESGPDGKPFRYVRRLADGGIYTSDRALEFGLIDRIGHLDDAVTAVRESAGLSEDVRVITYERPWSLSDSLVGIRAPDPQGHFGPAALADAATPRLWYLAPGSDLAAILTPLARSRR
jgi:protease IV